jgi:hypothetical protein
MAMQGGRGQGASRLHGWPGNDEQCNKRLPGALSTQPEINVNFGKQNRRCGLPMHCEAASAPQCEHCKYEPSQRRAGSDSQKHIYFWVST